MKTYKNILKLIIVSLFMILSFSFLFSCDNTPAASDDGTTDGTSESSGDDATDGELKIIGGENPYLVLRSDSPSALYELEAAVKLKNAIKTATGIEEVKITTDWEKNGISDYEICVGELNRNGIYYTVDSSELNSDEFLVKVCGTRVILIGCTGYGTQKAVEWFISEYLSVDAGTLTELTLPADFSYVGKFDLSDHIRIMTQNLLATDTEYPGYVKDPEWADRITVDLSQHTLAKRQPKILALIEKYAPDSMGVQECSTSWCNYFDKNLASIGYKRVGASKNQKIGIIYNTETLKLIEDGSIWLTEKPDSLKISKEWTNGSDGITERLAMYAVFEVKETGMRYIHFNTHIDTKKNDIIQGKQTEVIIQYMEDIIKEYDGIPAVLTGDFNYNTGAPEYKLLLNSGLLAAKKESIISTGAGSFNKFIGSSYHTSPIDHIIGTDKFTYYEYHVIYDMDGNNFLSDHYAVMADIAFKE